MKKYLLIAALAGLSLVACSGSKGSTEGTAKGSAAGTEQGSQAGTDKGTDSAKAEAKGGTLIMATNAEFPPYEYHEGKDIVGIDVDIAEAIAEEMGMKLEISDLAFDAIIPAVQSGKADFGAAGMTVNEDRLKNVDGGRTAGNHRRPVFYRRFRRKKRRTFSEGSRCGSGLTGRQG